MDRPEILTRQFEADLEVKDGRTIYGRCVPYDSAATVADPPEFKPYREGFRIGAYSAATKAPNRVRFNYMHSRMLPDQVGKVAALEERTDGLYGELFAVSDHALELVRSGAVGGLSLGFVPLVKGVRSEDGVIWRTRCRLIEVSLVHEPAYKEAEVLAVRSEAPAQLQWDSDLDDRLKRLGVLK